MKIRLKTTVILAFLLTISFGIQAQTGPGGVGSSATNPLWLRADDIALTAGQDVTEWADTSGNDNDFEQTGAFEPTFQTQDGIKVVRFDGDDDFLEDKVGFAGYTARTAFVVYRVDVNLQQNTDLGQLWGHYQGGTQIAVDARGGNLQGFSFDGSSSDRAKYGRNGAAYSGNVRDDNSDPWVYGDFEVVAVEFDSDRNLTEHFIGNLVNPAGHYFGGDIAEIVVYSNQLNDAQRVIVENYLAAKYAITITNDVYSYQDTYNNEVAGIGQISGSSHTSAFSGQVLKIENPSGLANTEYLMFGHEGSSVNSWTTTNTPFSGNNISRIAREWRLDETNGDVGTIDLTIDTSLFAARPAGYSKFVVMLDADGDFSDADRIYELVSGGGDEFFSYTGLEIEDGDYVTIAAVKPVVQFSLTESSGFEDDACAITVSSNFVLQGDVTVQVTTADVSATAGNDYTALSSQDVTINAGSISTDVNVTINDDGTAPEDDESFTLTLSSATVEIGAQNVHTYTIHDNDNARKVFFADINPSAVENTGSIDVTLEISTANATTSVDYRVIGGTATEGALNDYTLAAGTITFDAGTTKDITITLNDDGIPEPDETIIIELYNPIEANLSQTAGQPIKDTITIQDDGDEARKIAFLTDSISNSENVTSYSIQYGLSGVTGFDVSVDYAITGSGVNGTDYNLNDGSLTIVAGNTSANLVLPIINDEVEEVMDTIIITLSNPTNADLGTKTVFKYYILNDDFGYTGPGGIGSNIAVPQWFRADKDVTYDGGNNVTEWGDYSGNGYDATPGDVGTEPLYVASAINGMPAIEFQGGARSSNPTDSEWLQWTASGTGYQAQEVFAVFMVDNTLMSTTSLGQIWGSYSDSMHVAVEARSGSIQQGFSFDGFPSLGGQARYGLDGTGFNDYSTGSKDYEWVYDQWHLVTADFDKVNTLESNNIGHLEANGGGANDYWFGGRIAEIAIFSSTVDTADRIIIENYLAAKYGITITRDYYAHQATYKYDLAGIGRYDEDNYHAKAQSGGMLTLSEASDMGDGEYFMYAHDNGDISSWTDTETPSSSYERIAREWRFDQTGGSLGTFTVEVDLSDAAALPADVTQLVLMVDADGDFSAGATEYVLVDQGSDIYLAENLTISDDDYVTISGKIPTISFEADFISAIESTTSPSVNVVLSENAVTDVTVDYVLVAGGTATGGGDDYTFVDGQATITAGTSSTTIDFTITDDTDSESNEYLFIRIENPTNATLGTFSDLTFYILDNDGLEWQGPGGVGNLTDQVNVWLSTTAVTNINDRDEVADGANAWVNQSENANLDAFQSVVSQQPTFYSTTVQWNYRPIIDFQAANRQFLEIADNSFMNTAPNSAPQTQRSIVVVFRPSSDVTNRQVIFEEGGGARGLNIYLESGKIHLGAWNDVDDAGPGTAWKFLSSNSTISGNQPYFALLEFDTPNLVPGDGEVRGTVNGTEFAPIAGAGTLYAHGGDIGIGAMNNASCFEGSGGPGTEDCDGGEDHYFDGYFTEFISSNVIYNEAQKHILFNYLSSKYGITLTSTDYYEYDNANSYSYELFGIGQVDIDNSHIAAQGSGIIKIESPQNLEDGEFLFIGHDTNLVDGWVQNNIPNADSNIYRVERTWRVDETGDVGSITFKVDTSLFDSKPANTDYYCLIVDADGDFSSGATIKTIETKDADDLYTISGIDFAKGDYFTIGCIKPAMDFQVATGESSEPATPTETITATIELNVELASDATIDYTFVDVTATNTSDYDGTNGTFTMTAGSTSGTISFDINDDLEGEGNETFEIVLSNISPAEVAIGFDTTYTYTIVDDDETRKVNFGELTRSGAEDVGEDTAFVVLTTVAPGAGVSVDYEILGTSTASSGNIDYDFVQSGTLNFASGEDSVLLIFDVVEDALDELDETINFRITNPIGNVNLGDDTEFTYTIQDNDDLPEVQFGEPTGSGMESFSPIQIPVILNANSGQDIEVTFEVDGASTADPGGIDFTLDYTTVTIPAGEDTAYISVSIVNDKGQDDNETIIINLLSADYATVAGNTTFTYTIIDDDFGGWEGPGGIGNLDNQVGCWLRSTQVYNITNGVDVGVNGSATMWEDQSNNGNNAYDRDAVSTYGAPEYYDDDATWNKRPVLWFRSDQNDILEIADNDEMNRPSGAQTKRTLIVVFRPTDISSTQVIFEEGGGWRGLNIYIEDDTLNIGGYNVGGQAGEVQWDYIPIRYELEANKPYFAILQFDFEDGSGDVRGALNGSDFTTLPGADLLYPHGDNIGIGGVNGGALGIGNVSLNRNTSYYSGYFAEFMSGNFVYNTAQLLILQNYLGAKYNIDLGAKDIYDYDAIHGWELLGIGQKAGDNSHNKAQGQGMILLTNPSDLDNDEFMLIGHDNGLPYDNDLISGIEQWIPVGNGLDIPNSDTNFVRVAQEWRVDMVGDVGTVNIDVDLRNQGGNGQFDVIDPEYEKYVFMVDADGDFTDGATIYELKEDTDPQNNGYYVIENYDFNVGDYFTIGLGNPAVGFELAVDEDMEDVGVDHSINVNLNMVATSAITVDYKIDAKTATAGADYTDLSGTLTFAAGQTAKTLDITLLNDGDQEDDETFELILYNPSGAVLTQDTLVFTIHDDDNANKVNFAMAADSDSENTGSYVISVTRTDGSGASEVDYSVTGGTATSGDDFTLADGTLVFSGSSLTGDISITVNEDLLDEDDETIILSLTNPTGCALGTTTEFTLTITDNDTEPTIAFTSGTGFGSESYSPALVEVTLSAVSGKDVTVDYSATDGTATNGGIDYNLAPGTLTISAGETVGYIEPDIFNDLIATADKDFTINLASPSNATLGATTAHVYTILDDDDLGFEGPGGVGNETQYAFWYRANAESYTNGQTVNEFNDQSGNDKGATLYSGTPTFTTNAMNGEPAVYFDGSNDMLQIPGSDIDIDNTSYTVKSIVVAFRTGTNVSNRQVIYEQGGGNTGLSIYIYNNLIYYTAYNYTGGGWDMAAITNNIATSTNYSAVLIFDKSDEMADGTLKAYLNGELIGTYSTISEPLARSNRRNNGLGGMRDGMRYEDGTSITGTDGNYFEGYIAEVTHYNFALNPAQRVIVENYMASKYGASIVSSSDMDNYKGTHGHHIIGLGQDGTDNHVKAQGTSMATIDQPAGMVSGDYILIGDDDGDVSAWNDVPGFYDGTAQLLDREWRVSKTATGLTTIRFGVDVVSAPVPAKPADYPTYIIIVDPDNDGDGDITTNQDDLTIYALASPVGNTLRIENAILNDGDYIRVGVAKNRSKQSGNWHDKNTWLIDVPKPYTIETAYISAGDVVTVNSEVIKVGTIIIDNTGELIINQKVEVYKNITNNGDMTLSSGVYLVFNRDAGITNNNNITFEPGSWVKHSSGFSYTQDIAGLDYSNLYVSNGNYNISEDISCNNFYHYYSGNINIVGSARFTISGNWDTYNGTPVFNAGLGTVEWVGSGNKYIEIDAEFNNLVINKSNGFVYNTKSMNVANNLTLTNGLLYAFKDIVVTNTASNAVQGASSSSYVRVDGTGDFIRNVATGTSYEFPVGDANEYSPVNVTLNSGTLAGGANIAVDVENSKYSTLLPGSYIKRTWGIQPTGITSPNYDVELFYTDADIVGTESKIMPVKFDDYAGTNMQHGDLGDIDVATNKLFWDGLTSFSVFTGADYEALPVELGEFKAYMVDDYVKLDWFTVSETNNEKFVVLKSIDGENFYKIDEVYGSGTTQERTDYDYLDFEPVVGTSFYKLVQVDYDGTQTHTERVSVQYYPEFESNHSIGIYPNPVSHNQDVKILLAGYEANEKVEIQIYTYLGSKVYNNVVLTDEIGSLQHDIPAMNFYEPGIYVVHIISHYGIENKRIVIE